MDMQIYAIQKAIEALEALGGEGSLQERVSNAWSGHLAWVDERLVEDAVEIRRAMKEAFIAFQGEDVAAQSEAIRHVIKEIFNEEGYAKALRERSSD